MSAGLPRRSSWLFYTRQWVTLNGPEPLKKLFVRPSVSQSVRRSKSGVPGLARRALAMSAPAPREVPLGAIMRTTQAPLPSSPTTNPSLSCVTNNPWALRACAPCSFEWRWAAKPLVPSRRRAASRRSITLHLLCLPSRPEHPLHGLPHCGAGASWRRSPRTRASSDHFFLG